jgi:hypothetical protein
MEDDMPEFFVHWNRIKKSVRIHRAECGACNRGQGMHLGKIAAGRGHTYDWIGFETYEGALPAARKLATQIGSRKRIGCGLCSPQESERNRGRDGTQAS